MVSYSMDLIKDNYNTPTYSPVVTHSERTEANAGCEQSLLSEDTSCSFIFLCTVEYFIIKPH